MEDRIGNLYARLASCFPLDGARPFIRFADGSALSYGELEAATARYAAALVALGVRPGDRVALQTAKSPEMLFLYLGCLRCGGVFLPLNPAYPAGELNYFLRDSEPILLVCDPARRDESQALAEAIGGIRVETLSADGNGSIVDLASHQDAAFDTVDRAPDDLAAILYTSGTTGRSKGAMLSHANLASNAFVLRDLWRFTAADILLHALPIFHTHGLFVATNVTLASGCSMLFLPSFDAGQVAALLPRSTVMMGVPTFYIRLLAEQGLTRESVAGMRLFISGSAPLSADIHREFAERTGHAILERYGMTETNMNTSNPYDGDRVAGTVGLPLPGTDIRIADPETGTPLHTGEIGVIEIRGPNVFKGYWRQPEKTAAEFRGGYFISGDLGLVDDRGYVSIVGRAKDLIIAGGLNIYPAEVESVIEELPAVLESAVVGVPHPDLGEVAVAVIVLRTPEGAMAEDVLEELGGRLARYKVPRAVFIVDELPKNAMGKIEKAVLRARYARSFLTSRT